MTNALPAPEQTDNPDIRHESRDVSIRGILLTASALVFIAIVIHVGVWRLFEHLDAREKRSKASPFPLAGQERGKLPPEPRLEGIKRMDEDNVDLPSGILKPPPLSQLDHYDWVDRKTGVVQIPLDRAMQLILENQRLPVRTQKVDGQSERPDLSKPSKANSGRPRNREKP